MMRTRRGMVFLSGGGSLIIRVVLVFLVVASWLLFAGIVTVADNNRVSFSSSSNEMLKHWKWKHNGVRERNRLVYVSKRKVPNGPDPIHNRRAAKTRTPPSA